MLCHYQMVILQLRNYHVITQKASQDTFAFLNYRFSNKEEIKLNELNLFSPFSILTANEKPWQYGWILIGERDVKYNLQFRGNISSLGLYNKFSTDPSVLLEPYFGLFPWDGYYKDDYLNDHILPNAPKRADVKYLKDFTTEELKKLLPANSPKLIARLKEEQNL
jgi:hypothetical protein